MEIIDTELGEFTLRRRSLLVSHVAAGLTRGLEPDEQVVVRGPAGEHYRARVADIAFDLTDTVYRLRLGAPVSAEEAERTQRADAAAAAGVLPASEPVSEAELLGLLAELGDHWQLGSRRRGDAAL